jgi:alcohol dehydrogenase class IV
MSISFNFAVPTRISFGEDSLSGLAPAVAEVGRRALILAGHRSARGSGLLDRCLTDLRMAGITTRVADGIGTNPGYDLIVEVREQVASDDVDAIIAIGGGSVMDAGRAVALALARPGDFWECRVTGSESVAGIPEQLQPVFTVPTVHGTGAELSPAMLLTRENSKEVFFSPHLFPRATFVVPSLATTVPPRTTAEVGVDAFIQGLEAYVSRTAQPFSDLFAWEAMRLAARWLPEAVRRPEDQAARAQVALAALFSLFAINQAGVGGIHALSNPLSGRYRIHHGRALSLVAAAVVDHNRRAAPERFARVGELLVEAVHARPRTSESAAGDVTAAVRDWLATIDLGGRLADYGVQGRDLEAMAHEAQNPDMSTNPCELPPRDVRTIYETVM